MVTERYIAKILRKYGYHPDDQIARRMIQEVERDTRLGCAEAIVAIAPTAEGAKYVVMNAVLDVREESGE